MSHRSKFALGVALGTIIYGWLVEHRSALQSWFGGGV
jgi:hypothetical protein